MCKRFVTGLLRSSLVAIIVMAVGTEAEAGCKKIQTNGPTICASWITGSLFCDNLIKGLPAKLAKNCDPDKPETCPVITECSAFGTFGDDPACADETVLDPDADCEIIGDVRCLNPNGHFNDQGTAFFAGPLTEATGTTTCTKGGKCVNDAEVQPEDDGGLCPGPSQTGSDQWSFEFTPDEFKGQVCICPGGLDSFGRCCENEKRTGDGACVKLFSADPGELGCIEEFCERNAQGTGFDCTLIALAE